MLGMKRTSEKVARLVWFCGAAGAAFLRATGSLSVQVRPNANCSYSFALGLAWVDVATLIGQSQVFRWTHTLVFDHKFIYTRVSCCRSAGISYRVPYSQGGACVYHYVLV